MRRPIPLRPAAGLLAAAAAGAWLLTSIPAAPGATGGGKSIDDYRLLTDRNIFDRNRRAPRPPRTDNAPRLLPPDPDSGIVLTGIAKSADRYVAFFERPSGATARVGAGEAIGKGKIKALTLNSVQYEREGVVRTVPVGHSLLGDPRTRPKVLRGPTTMPATSGPGSEIASADNTAAGPTTEPAEPSEATPAGPSETTPAAGPSGSSGNQSIADLIEQMRRRRERELSR